MYQKKETVETVARIFAKPRKRNQNPCNFMNLESAKSFYNINNLTRFRHSK